MPLRIIALCLLLLSATSCNKDAIVVTALQDAERLIQEHPDSALNLIVRIRQSKIRSTKTRAKYALLYSQALDKNYIDTDNDSLIRIAVDYYANHGSEAERAGAYYYYSVVRSNAMDSESAVEALVAARSYAERCDNIYLRGQIHSSLGGMYYAQYSFEEAADAYSQAASCFRQCNRREQLMYALYSEGLSLCHSGRYSESLSRLSEAREIASKAHDTENVLNITSSIGGIKLKIRLDSASLHDFKCELFGLYDRHTAGQVPSRHYPIVGNIYFQERNLDSAYYYFTEYWSQTPAVTALNVGTLALLSRIEQQRNHYETAWQYENRYAYFSDSLNTAHSSELIRHLETRYRTKYLERSYASLQTKRRHEIATLILIIALLVLVGWMIIVSRKRALAERNRKILGYEQYVEETHVLYGELQSRYDAIRASVQTNDNRSNALFVLLGNRIRSLQQLLEWAMIYESDPIAFYQRFKEYMKVTSGNNRQLMEDAIAIADLTCHGIVDYLRKHYPSLSPYELCYCGFVCLGFSAESIRILFNHTNIYSIYTMRSKIRNKLGLKNSREKLETYILGIMENLRI